MERRSFLGLSGAAFISGMGLVSCNSGKEKAGRKKLFSFVHFTDCHVQPESGAKEGLLAAIEKINSLNPDFVVGGGDFVMDSLKQDEERATILYDLYIECTKNFKMPLYNVIGNHECFGLYVPDKVPESHPLWGKEMFKKRLGDGVTYRSFDKNGVHLVLLDSIQFEKNTDKPGYDYYGGIGQEQLEWLKTDLAKIPDDMPLIVFSHIPLVTYYQFMMNGPYTTPPSWMSIRDSKDLYEILSKKRMLAFFQGHMHINELYKYMASEYIVTGAVCGAWWTGPHEGNPEGFSLVNVYTDGVEYEYITYGWDSAKYKENKNV